VLNPSLFTRVNGLGICLEVGKTWRIQESKELGVSLIEAGKAVFSLGEKNISSSSSMVLFVSDL
jgi:hypothetical protein